jgi:putative heme-binding domain-containing protein
VTGLLSRANRVPAVMNAVGRGAIPVADLFSPTINFLRTYPDPTVSERAVAALGPVAFQRPAAVEQYKGALRLSGVASRGQELFSARCAACHVFRAGPGRFVGPDLGGVRLRGKERLLSDIIEPNLRIDPNYRTYLIETVDSEVFAGVLADRTAASLTLLSGPGTATVWPMLNVRAAVPQVWSLMPDGLEQGLSPQNMADLLEFMRQAN